MYDETQTPKIKLPSSYFIFSPQLQLLMALFILLKWSYRNYKNSFVIVFLFLSNNQCSVNRWQGRLSSCRQSVSLGVEIEKVSFMRIAGSLVSSTMVLWYMVRYNIEYFLTPQLERYEYSINDVWIRSYSSNQFMQLVSWSFYVK